MNEITLTVVAQIAHFFLVWYVFHTFLLKKVFNLLHKKKYEDAVLSENIVVAQRELDSMHELRRREWKKFLELFAHRIPYRLRKTEQPDGTPLCPVSPGLPDQERHDVIKQTVDYLTRKIVRGN